jgi:hypothetical protein
MIRFIYRCPTTDCEVEGREPEPRPRGLHIVNPASGRLIAEEIARPAASRLAPCGLTTL